MIEKYTRQGRLVVKYKLPHRNSYVCRCDCGNLVTLQENVFRTGRKSCGCNTIERSWLTKHGMYLSSEYNVWRNMKARCCNKNIPDYQNYGAKGITVSEEWKNSFAAFYRDIGKRPSMKHTIDRIDVTKGYEKENCRWSAPLEQHGNKRGNIKIFVDGVWYPSLNQACTRYNARHGMVLLRLQRGWNFVDAISFKSRKEKTTNESLKS